MPFRQNETMNRKNKATYVSRPIQLNSTGVTLADIQRTARDCRILAKAVHDASTRVVVGADEDVSDLNQTSETRSGNKEDPRKNAYHVSPRPYIVLLVVHARAKTHQIREVGNEELTIADEEPNPIVVNLNPASSINVTQLSCMHLPAASQDTVELRVHHPTHPRPLDE